jgi:uncharacterized membrane protein
MDIALFKMSGLDFMFRWMHYLGGVAWIGMLWYFNFVQGAWFKECEPETKKKATQLLVPRALWWFRWGAMLTFLTGVVLLISKVHMSGGMSVFNSSWGVTIMTGGLLGTIMFLNVWLVIWPAQKIVIAAAKGENVGGADPAAAAARGGLASRTNTLFSIPLLFMMGAASHLPISIADETSVTKAMIAVGIAAFLLELNALKGKLGPLTSISGVIHCGVWLTVVLYGAIEFFC